MIHIKVLYIITWYIYKFNSFNDVINFPLVNK